MVPDCFQHIIMMHCVRSSYEDGVNIWAGAKLGRGGKRVLNIEFPCRLFRALKVAP